MLPKIKMWTDKRATALKTRWNEDKQRQSLQFWEALFISISKSDFLTGKASQWQADLEWIVNASNLVKILEGKYNNRDVVIKEKESQEWRNNDALMVKKAAELKINTKGKTRFELIAAIDMKMREL